MKDVLKFPEMDYFMNEELSDVVFVVRGQRLPALKSFLSVRNKVFRNMFSKKSFNEKEVVIDCNTFEAFKTFMVFIHCNQLILEDQNNVELILEVLQLCDKYEASGLQHILRKEFKKMTIGFNNLKLITSIAFHYKWHFCISNVLAFIEHNFDEFIDNNINELEKWNKLTENRVSKIFNNNYRKINNQFKGLKKFKVQKNQIKCQNSALVPKKLNANHSRVNHNQRQRRIFGPSPYPNSTKPHQNNILKFNGTGRSAFIKLIIIIMNFLINFFKSLF